jgi:hypothetical protein
MRRTGRLAVVVYSIRNIAITITMTIAMTTRNPMIARPIAATRTILNITQPKSAARIRTRSAASTNPPNAILLRSICFLAEDMAML